MTTKLTADRGRLQNREGLSLYYECDPVDRPRATLIFTHGFAEHCGRYAAMAKMLNGEGYSCYRFDLRGHGRSEGRRGHIYRFADFVNDFRDFSNAVFATAPADVPRIAVTHSNGGLIALTALSQDATGFAGLVCSSPFVGFKLKLPLWKAAAGRIFSRFVPALAMPTDLPPESVSSDPATIEQYANDPLIVRVATARWLIETYAAMDALPALLPRLKLPVLFQVAGDDQIADAQASRAMFERVGSSDRTWQEYAGLRHEIWFEREREREKVYAALREWLSAHTEQPA
ncbi:MAG: lysophospholipase [Myxococcales bacterium]|nr:lysophospholipase [Myxococcales bacterium]